MARRARVVWTGCPYHVVQKANRGEPVFEFDADFEIYLKLLKRAREKASVKILAYALMNNHIHIILIPEFGDSMARLFREVSRCFAQTFNVTRGFHGRVWESRYYSAPMSPLHLHHALRYVELNPVRAGLSSMANSYPWTSALAHCEGWDSTGILDMSLLASKGGPRAWLRMLERGNRDPREREINHFLRACTYAERPFGDEEFVAEAERRLGLEYRRWPFCRSLESDEVAYSLEHLPPTLSMVAGD